MNTTFSPTTKEYLLSKAVKTGRYINGLGVIYYFDANNKEIGYETSYGACMAVTGTERQWHQTEFDKMIFTEIK